MKQHPDSSILENYQQWDMGVGGFNRSVLSLNRMVHYLEPLNAEAMVATGQEESENLTMRLS